jgi:hypothetical protein
MERRIFSTTQECITQEEARQILAQCWIDEFQPKREIRIDYISDLCHQVQKESLPFTVHFMYWKEGPPHVPKHYVMMDGMIFGSDKSRKDAEQGAACFILQHWDYARIAYVQKEGMPRNIITRSMRGMNPQMEGAREEKKEEGTIAMTKTGIRCSNARMIRFCNRAIVATVQYHRTRKELFQYFTDAIETPPYDMHITDELYLSIVGFLQTRNNEMIDAQKLAFHTAILNLRKLCAPIEAQFVHIGPDEPFGVGDLIWPSRAFEKWPAELFMNKAESINELDLDLLYIVRAMKTELQRVYPEDQAGKIALTLFNSMQVAFLQKSSELLTYILDEFPYIGFPYDVHNFDEFYTKCCEDDDEGLECKVLKKCFYTHQAVWCYFGRVVTELVEEEESIKKYFEVSLEGPEEYVRRKKGLPIEPQMFAAFKQKITSWKDVHVFHHLVVPKWFTELRDALGLQGNVKASIFGIETLISVMALAYACHNTDDLSVQMAMILSWITAGGLNKVINAACVFVPMLVFYLKSVKIEVGGVETQGDGSHTCEGGNPENIFMAFVEVVKGAFSFTDQFTLKLNDKRVARINSHLNLMKTMKNFFEGLYNLALEVFYYMYECITGHPYGADAQKLAERFAEWLGRAQKFIFDDPVKEFRENPSMLYDIRELMAQYDALNGELVKMESMKHSLQPVHSLYNRLLSQHKEMLAHMQEVKPRKLPLSVYIIGEPGVGKSVFSTILGGIFLGSKFGSKDVYARNPMEAFWSGYQGQPIVFMDDIAQMDSVEHMRVIAMDYIRMVNDMPYSLPMASISDKGNTYFTSEYVITTSNEKSPMTKQQLGIQDPAAFYRRAHAYVKVRAKERSGSELDIAAYEFQLGNPLSQQPFDESAPWIDMKEFLLVLERKKRALAKSNKSVLTYLMDNRSALEAWRTFIKNSIDAEEQLQKDAMAAASQKLDTELEVKYDQFVEYQKKIDERVKKEINDRRLTPMDSCDEASDRDDYHSVDDTEGQGGAIEPQCLETNCSCPFKRKDFPEMTDQQYMAIHERINGKKMPFYRASVREKIIKDAINSVIATLQSTICSHPVATIIVSALGAMAVVGGVFALIQTFRQPEKIEPETSTAAIRQGRGRWQIRRTAVAPVTHKIVPQSQPIECQMSVGCSDIIEHVVAPNLARIVLRVDDDTRRANAYFLCERMFVTVGHIFRFGFQNANMTLHWNGKEYKLDRSQFKICFAAAQDLCFVRIFDRSVPMAKNAIGHFAKESDLELNVGRRLNMASKTLGGTVMTQQMVDIDHLPHLAYGSTYPSNSERVIWGSIPTQKGDCGGVYVVDNDQWVRKLLAVHICGDGNASGGGTIVTQELLKEAAKHLTVEEQMEVVKVFEYDREKALFKVPEKLEDNITIVGRVEPAHYIPSKCTIKPSLISGIFIEPKEIPSQIKPMRKKDGTIVDPCEVMFKKLNRPKTCNADPALVKRVAQSAVRAMPCIYTPRKLTMHEALNGVKGLKEMGAIKRNNSRGWPASTLGELGKGKQAYFDLAEDGTTLLPTPLFMEEFQQFEYQLKHDPEKLKQNPDLVTWCYNLKSERLPWDKVLDSLGDPVGNTRGMACCGVVLLVWLRMYFGMFLINNVAAHATHPCSMGINPHSATWKRVKHRLTRYGRSRLRAGDFSKFDASLKRLLTQEVWGAIDDWYRQNGEWCPEDRKIRMLFHDLIHNALCLLKDCLFRTDGGNQSGQFLTTVENVWALFIAMVVCWAQFERDKGNDPDIDELVDMLILAAFGDDHVAAFPEEYDDFDCQVIAKYMKQLFDMTYTAFDKKSELKKLYDIDEVTYLCRKWHEIDFIDFAPLDLENIDDCLNFTDTAVCDLKEGLEATAVNAKFEYFHHPEVFDQRMRDLNQALRVNGCKEVTGNWNSVFNKYHSGAVPLPQFIETQSEPVKTVTKEESQPIVNPQNTQVTSTVTFGDNVSHEVPALTQTAPVVDISVGDDPYEDQGVSKVVSREYLINTITWSGAANVGMKIAEISFPDALLAIPNISEKLSRFQYIKTGSRITLRINGTSYHFGALLVCMVPHTSDDVFPKARYFYDMYVASNLDTDILSPNTNATVDIVIPYVAPSRFQNLSNTDVGFTGKLVFYVLAPLRLASAATTPTLTVSVFAHLENLKAAGLGLRTPALKRPVPKMDTQSEQVKKTDLKTQITQAPTEIGKGITTVIKGITAIQSAASPFLSLAKNVLMDKPADLSTPMRVRIDTNSGFASGNGADLAEPLGIDPENRVAYDPSIYGKKRDYNRFVDYKLLPALFLTGSWDGSAAPGTRIASFAVAPTVCNIRNTGSRNIVDVTHIANLATNFKYWTGSMKYCFMFFTSKFVSGRVVIKWIPDPTFSSPLTNSVFGDTISHVVDITGDTVYAFTVPWLKDRRWDRVPAYVETVEPVSSWSGFNGRIVVELINQLTISDSSSDAEVFFAAFVSGGEDFDVNRPTDLDTTFYSEVPYIGDKKVVPTMDTQSENIKVTKLQNMRSMFEEAFPGLNEITLKVEEKISHGEVYRTWTELFRRYSLVLQESISGSTNYVAQISLFLDANGDITPIKRMLRTFHYKKGCTRVKSRITANIPLLIKAENSYVDVFDPYDTDLGSGINGIATTESEERPWIEVAAPYYSPFDMHTNAHFTTEYEEQPCVRITATDGSGGSAAFNGNAFHLAALGDDFSLGWPTTPVPLAYTVEQEDNNSKSHALKDSFVTARPRTPSPRGNMPLAHKKV